MSTTVQPSSDTPLRAWMDLNDYSTDFNARLARQFSFPSDQFNQIESEQCLVTPTRSQQTSIIVHTNSEYDLDSMASDNLPALTRGNSVASTYSATSTNMASVIDGGCVLESEDGVLTVPPRLQADADLLCPFQVLECHETFSDIVEFKIHVFSHFRGHPLPDYAVCFVCTRPFFRQPEDDLALSWNQLLTHMVWSHYRSGEVSLVIRPSMAVMRYMWNRGIISDAEFKRTQLVAWQTQLPRRQHHGYALSQISEVPMAPSAPIPRQIQEHLDQSVSSQPVLNQSVGSSNEPYTVSAGRRQERRQRDRLRTTARPRGHL